MNTQSISWALCACMLCLVAACGDDNDTASQCEGDDCGAAGNNAPGNNAPGNNAPGNNAPGNNAPGNNAPGNNAPGNNDVECVYPSGAAQNLVFEQVVPAMSWEGLYGPGGEKMNFSMEQFHCDPAYDKYSSLVFVIGAGWCVACPDYISYVDSLAAELESLGMLVVFVEAEDRNYSPATHDDAQSFITNIIGDTNGMRLGDGQTLPEARQIYNSPALSAFPSAYVVRRSDMTVITEQRLSDFLLPFTDIAADPDADWSVPGAGEFEPACGPEDEESFEPNDDPMTAPTIGLGSFDGGICAPAPDFYRVEIEGPWQLDLEFSHATGDLDVYEWDFNTNDLSRSNFSFSETDNETLRGFGPATVAVVGFRFASAPYTLTLSEAEPICTDEQSAASEPNNSPEEAIAIEPGTFEDGICDNESDYFQVNIEGDWSLEIAFAHDTGDLDVYVWDAENEQPVFESDGMTPIGSDSTDDNESFTHSGPALVRIIGFRSAQAPYTLTLAEIE